MKKYLFVIAPVIALFIGCLGDNIDAPQIVPSPIFPPGQVFYTCITGTTDLQIRWTPPVVDTQRNFKGYLLVLYKSAPFYKPSDDGLDSVTDPIDTAHVPKIDTTCPFHNMILDKRYTIRIWGEQNTDTSKKKDSVIYSLGFAGLSFTYDSRPVFAPTQIFASSNGENSVNLFWSQSSAEGNSGFAGYITRFIDPDNSAAQLTYLMKTFVPDSNLISGKYHTAIASTTPNSSPPVEKEYKFWIKAIRKDSVESDDAISITWSGAEALSTPATLDTGIFIGQQNFGYGMVQIDPNGGSASFQITQSGGNFVINGTLPGKNNTLFVNQIDTSYTLSRSFPAKVFAASDFSQSQISFPVANNGTIVYALFPNGSRARLLFTQAKDTTTQLITNQIQAMFQPQETPQLPFF